MPLTDSIAVVTEYLYDKFNVQAVKDTLGLVDVFYGDQALIPRSPALCVEPGPKIRDFHGAMRRTDNTITVYLIAYHSEIRSTETNQREVVELGEAIELIVHQDKTLGGLVTESHCSQVVPGYAKKGQPMRAIRIVVEASTLTMLP
jgi:hypothetical protein